jgi:hypothetical protein
MLGRIWSGFLAVRRLELRCNPLLCSDLNLAMLILKLLHLATPDSWTYGVRYSLRLPTNDTPTRVDRLSVRTPKNVFSSLKANDDSHSNQSTLLDGWLSPQSGHVRLNPKNATPFS